ncbi:MAG: hypothetical protein GXP16_01540 [Gammaproteobacteria bacterium]|nr:hypothetical protein [Gammaproteobacteria bacterium]
MNNEAARILLAEWQGWVKLLVPKNHPEYKFNHFIWEEPGYNGGEYSCPPNPHENANDCNDLITFLNGLGIQVHILFASDASIVTFIDVGSAKTLHAGEYNNWLHGVCELAVKIREREID